MNRILPLIVAIASLLPSAAHADDKASAILNEARVRINKVTAYDVRIRSEDNSPQPRMRFILERENNLRTDYVGIGNDGALMIRGTEPDFDENGNAPLFTPNGPDYFPARNNINHLANNIYNLVSLKFINSFKEPVITTYITQKMLDEKTMVDVIDIEEKGTGNRVRLYIDNNSLLRKIVASGSGKNSTVLFTDIVLDEPVIKVKFTAK